METNVLEREGLKRIHRFAFCLTFCTLLAVADFHPEDVVQEQRMGFSLWNANMNSTIKVRSGAWNILPMKPSWGTSRTLHSSLNTKHALFLTISICLS